MLKVRQRGCSTGGSVGGWVPIPCLHLHGMVWRRLRLFVAVAQANPYRLIHAAELSLRKHCGVEGCRAQPQGVSGTSGWLKCVDMDSQLQSVTAELLNVLLQA